MNHYETILATMHRPRTLIRAARHGATFYRRDRDLKLIRKDGGHLSGADVVDRLIDFEDALEATRKSGSAEYNVTSHVSVLTALIAEVKATAAPPPSAQA